MEFTNEQLIEQAQKNIAVLRGAAERIPGASDTAVIHLRLAEITLAALTAEPVYQVVYDSDTWRDINQAQFADHVNHGSPVRIVYTAPPAPVLPEDIPDSVYDILCQACGGKAWMYEDALWKACRDAMINGDKS